MFDVTNTTTLPVFFIYTALELMKVKGPKRRNSSKDRKFHYLPFTGVQQGVKKNNHKIA